MAALDKRQCIADAITLWQAGLYRLAMSYVHSSADAMDVVQDAAYKALRASDSLIDPAGVKPWLARIVVNTALDCLRRRREVPTEQLPDRGQSDNHERIEVLELLDTLDEGSRTVIVLHFFEGLTLAETAETLGEKESTVKSRMYRALRQLRADIEQEEA